MKEGKVLKDLEKRLEQLEYNQMLLLEMVNPEKYPFNMLIIRECISKQEVQELHKLCEKLTEMYEEQKAQGLVIFTELLTLFAGQLNYKLDVVETVQALYRQNLYKALMKTFLDIIKKQ
ncbi:DUF1878 family protein [Metabacillus fastidiosus]|uniref:DUF1878 family protein n=1 Tax=Metabacillus fastidiosus TaxID=1458 RepID=UPI003D2D7A0F